MRRVLHEPQPGILAVAAMWRPDMSEAEAFAALQTAYGRIEDRSGVFDFTQTHYYEREMGKGLRKVFVAFEGLHARDRLVALKHQATELEDRFLNADGTRRVNVDPMLVTLENVVVTTSKNFPHRVYLGRGVFGDLQLIRRKGGFEAFAWTYADYVDHSDFFESQHRYLREQQAAPDA